MKMKYVGILFFISTLLACASSSSYTSTKNVDMSKYKIGCITDVMSYSGSPELMDLEVIIYDLLTDASIRMIGEREINSLTTEEKKSLLLIKYAGRQTELTTSVSINFIEYETGRPVASCRGTSSMGLTMSHDLKIAINDAINQVKYLFGIKKRTNYIDGSSS